MMPRMTRVYMLCVCNRLKAYLRDAGGVGGDVFGVVGDGVGENAAEVGEELAEGAVAAPPVVVVSDTVIGVVKSIVNEGRFWWVREG